MFPTSPGFEESIPIASTGGLALAFAQAAPPWVPALAISILLGVPILCFVAAYFVRKREKAAEIAAQISAEQEKAARLKKRQETCRHQWEAIHWASSCDDEFYDAAKCVLCGKVIEYERRRD